jgi:predicted small metal-binding protein
MTSLELLEEIKKEKAYKIIWDHVKSYPNTDFIYTDIINQIGELFNLTNFNSARLLKIDRLLNDLMHRCQIKKEGNMFFVLGDRYMSNSDFNSWLLNGRNKMNNETSTNEVTINISTEIATDLTTIVEHMKKRVGVTLSNEQVIQHLIHQFKMTMPQGMCQQPLTSYPGQNPFPVPQMPMYPPGVRCVNPSQSTDINFDEEMNKRQ